MKLQFMNLTARLLVVALLIGFVSHMQQSGLYAAQEETDANKLQQAFMDALSREQANDQAIRDIRKKISATKAAIGKAEQSIADANITIREARNEITELDIEIADLEQDLALKAVDGYISSSITPQDADISEDFSISQYLAYQRSEFFFERLTDTEADAVEQYRIARQNRAVALGNELNGEKIKDRNEQELAILQEQEKERITEAKEIEAELLELIEEIKVLDEIEEEIKTIIKERATQEVIDNGALSWPVDNPYITSKFGYRTHPVTGARRLHRGLDLRARTGAPIYAAADGKVITATYAGNAGNLVIIDHGSGKTTYYMHLSTYATKSGTTIKRGDLVGKAGATGRVTAAHLHFEVRINGTAEDPLNHIVGAK